MLYAELHCKTNFSFLAGASHPQELVERAVELGYHALAVTDRNSLAGVVRAHGAAKDHGLKLLIGAEITPEDAPPVVLLATDRQAYGRLSRLITLGRRRAPKGECQLTFDDVAAHGEGLLAIVLPRHAEQRMTGEGRRTKGHITREDEASEIPVHQAASATTYSPIADAPPYFTLRPSFLCTDDSHAIGLHAAAEDGEPPLGVHPSSLQLYRKVFGDRCYLAAELLLGVDDRRRLQELIALSQRTGIPLVAAGDVHYHMPERMALYDVLTATRHGTTVAEAAELLLPNAQRHLRPLDEIRTVFAEAPAALARTAEIADRCHFSLDELRYEYPEELAPPGLSPMQHLRRLTWQGATQRYPAGVSSKVKRLLDHELALIEDLHYEAYFLTVWDLVRFARSRGILCQGRGSAANSAVCYCLGVTAVDPQQADLLFERFVSRERNEAPDIDIDFEHERREEVLQYLYDKYGRERTGMTAEVITYRTRSAIRDVGKALGLSLDRVDGLAKQVEGYHYESQLDERCRQVGIDPESNLGRRLVYLVQELIGFPRHLSQHVGGMVMTEGPLCELVPIENAATEDRTVIEWNKDDLDELGILKVDCLSLGMLTAIRKCFELLHRDSAGNASTKYEGHGANGALDTSSSFVLRTSHFGRSSFCPNSVLAQIPREDSQVYDMICAADTMGVFQIESRAQMTMLPRLRPRCYYDLVIEVAIVRPGPIQGNMVHPYLRRRSGDEPVTYPNQAIREVLHKTLGVPIFQEQAMRLAVVAAGFTPGEADGLRRAMGAWRRPGVIDQFRQKLLDGMRKRGLSQEFAEQVFRQIRGFGEYGFPESHAASFALLVYVSAWLKHYHPAAFTAALINSQPMGFYAPAQLIRDARDHGVRVLPVDVNHSDWDCTLEIASDEEEGGRTTEGGTLQGDAFQASDHHAADTATESPQAMDDVSSFILRPSSFALRLGFRLLVGLAERHARAIKGARRAGPFESVEDLTRRAGLSRAVIAKLAEADALASLGRDRRAALWEALAQEKKLQSMPLFDSLTAEDEDRVELPPLAEQQQVFADYQTAGLSLRDHPLSFYRQRLDQLRVTPAAALKHEPNGGRVSVAGLVILRQRPATARGITFVTIEDETGIANLVVHQKTWQRFYTVARRAAAYLAQGRLERKDAIIHVVVDRLEDMSQRMQQLNVKSRDFR